MPSDLTTSVSVSASGLRAQSARMRVIAENLANADSVSAQPGGDPYRRRVIDFGAELDAASGKGVEVRGVRTDTSQFRRIYQPGSPGADDQGFVLMPNVNPLIEAADMKAAQRSYEANLNAIEAARTMVSRTVDLLR